MKNIRMLMLTMSGAALLCSLPVQGATAQTATNLKCRGCVGTRDIAKGAVGTDTIQDNSINSAKIKRDTVNSLDIRDSTIAPVDLSPSAKPGGGNFLESETEIPVATNPTIIRFLTLPLPAPGMVMVSVGGFARFDTDETTPSALQCSITKGTASGDLEWIVSGLGTTNARRVSLGSSRAFLENEAGEQTYNLVCRTLTGEPVIQNLSMAAIYVPQILGERPEQETPNRVRDLAGANKD